MSKFQYKPREGSSTRKRAEQWGNDRESIFKDHVPIWRPKDGANTIRILPPTWVDAEHYGYDIYVHYGIGPDNSQFLDLVKMKQGADPITEEVQRARAEGDEEYAKKLDSKKRVLVYLIDRDRPRDGVMMWAMPWTVDKEIANQAYDTRTNEALPIDSPDDGYDVIITKSGVKDRTEYSVKLDRRSSVLEMTDAILDIIQQHPLPECLTFHTYEQKLKAFQGGASRAQPTEPENKAAKSSAQQPQASGSGRTKTNFNLNTLTWESVQAFNSRQLDQLFEQLIGEGYDVREQNESDAELCEAICNALGLKPPRTTTQRTQRQSAAAQQPTEEAEDDIPFDEGVDNAVVEPSAPAPTTTSSKVNEMKNRLANLRNQK